MSTPDLNSSNGQPQFASVSDLAAMLGVTKGAISRKASRFEREGRLQTRSEGPGKPKLIEIAAYLAAAEQTTDAIRAANAAQSAPSPSPPADPTLAQQQARRAAIRADLDQIELDKARGLLVPVAKVSEDMAHAAGELVRGLETLPGRAAELTVAIAQSGEQGVRAALKEFVHDLRERLAAAMTLSARETSEAVD